MIHSIRLKEKLIISASAPAVLLPSLLPRLAKKGYAVQPVELRGEIHLFRIWFLNMNANPAILETIKKYTF